MIQWTNMPRLEAWKMPRVVRWVLTFNNKQAAQKLKSTLVNAIALLKDNPYLGPKLSDRFNMDTSLRYLVVSKQLVFYNIKNNNIEIIRILDSRQDYLSLLF